MTIEKIRAKNKVVRAVIYARFSSDNQRDESIDAQMRAIQEYARRNDILIVGEYVDRARSAMTDNRPEFLRMIADAKKETFDVVLVHKLDRFARNRQDSIGYRMELKRHNVSLVSVLEYLDDESPESLILESVLEAMAEYYSKNLAREVNKGMRENALKAMHTGGLPPLGYDVDPITRKLIINEAEAGAVRLIFQLFLEGNGYGSIANELGKRGYRSKKGKVFSHNALHDILLNEKYAGVYVFNKASSKDIDGKRNSHSYKDAEETIRIEGGVPAIISKEDFAAVQRKMASRKQVRAAHNAKEVYLLSGKIFCGECGSAYLGNRKRSGRNKTLQVTYRCGGRKMKHNCLNKEIRREYIEAFVLEKLSEYVFDESLIPTLTQMYGEYATMRDADSIQKRETLKRSIAAVKKEIDNLLLLAARVSSDALADKLNELEIAKARQEAEYAALCEASKCPELTEEKVLEHFRKAQGLFVSGKLSTTKKLIELYVDKVIIFSDHVEARFIPQPDLMLPSSEEAGYISALAERRSTGVLSCGGQAKPRAASTTSERVSLVSIFYFLKNPSPAPLFLLFRKRSRSARLVGPKRPRDGSPSLPTFCGCAFGAWHFIVPGRHEKATCFDGSFF